MSQNLSNQNQPSQPAQAATSSFYSIEVVIQRTGLGVLMVQRCITYGIIHPQVAGEAAALYSENDLLRLRKVRRLVNELGLNWAGVEIVMRLTDELERLQQELNRLRP